MNSAFDDIYLRRHDIAKEEKAKGKKIFGYYCCHVPEELIHAAGILPVRISGSLENITEADSHLQQYICSFARSSLDQALKGRYGYLDGVVIPKTCDIIRNMYSVWARDVAVPHYFYLSVPAKNTKESRVCLAEEFKAFKSSLEGLYGGEIPEEALERSIEVYNENRRLLKTLYGLKGEDNPQISGSDFYRAVQAGFVISKERHNDMLSTLLKTVSPADDSPKKKLRVLVTGTEFENIAILKLIEEQGALIVADDLCVGTRYFWDLVNTDGDLIHALVNRYLGKIPCPCKHPSDDRIDNIVRQVQEYKADGVISVVQKFCDTHLYEHPYLKERLEREGVPYLFLETDDTLGGEGQFKTRIQAFMEMIS
ncbi:MAG: 2-hydroxyacyl-CoA dehydratase family protein [Pseudomonadota bacterium]